MHQCTDDDFEKFYTIDEGSVESVNNARKANEMWCLDWTALQFDIYGTWRTDDRYATLDVRMIPCAQRYTAFDGSKRGGDDSCEWDKQKVVNYLGTSVEG